MDNEIGFVIKIYQNMYR